MALNKSERGQSLVEMAFSLVMFLILVGGAVEIGLALFQYVTMRDAAQEGALYGSFNPADENGIKNRALDAVGDIMPNLTAADIDVTINGSSVADAVSGGYACEGLTASVPNFISVGITFVHPVTMPYIGERMGQSVNLDAGVTDTILSPACD